MNISIIIPAHNEEEVIAHTINGLEEYLGKDHEVIVINDHSVDKTATIVKYLMKQYSNLRLVDNDTPNGFANALKKGFSVANSEFVIPVMADLCDDPSIILRMCEKANSGLDIVCGSRYMLGGEKSGGPFIQGVASRFVGRTLKFFTGIPTNDVSNSFKCYRKSLLDNITIESRGFEISMEITLKAFFLGAKITEIPTVWKGREMGKSKFYLFKVAPNYVKLYLWALFGNKNG